MPGLLRQGLYFNPPNFRRVDPDYRLHVSSRLLQQNDGPTLEEML